MAVKRYRPTVVGRQSGREALPWRSIAGGTAPAELSRVSVVRATADPLESAAAPAPHRRPSKEQPVGVCFESEGYAGCIIANGWFAQLSRAMSQ